ncbi:CusA/CzcA family heavy metal efflux RND transporter [Portibacter lacus]|uniref:Acriflavine resistance protein B n=1 Tax=Portibacter lacus TaxID=1099794 RepID=A0AA37ST05_9BACT|nr:CusA/CzcA family heavy metal efflux RND transporter [Portibacter lacus]GLR17613.1 acriflavine resistance protein B [Portibacter lacus]
MFNRIINFSLKNKFLILLLIAGLVGFGIYSLLNIPIGAVPDVTNNQVQVITTSRDLPTEEVERFLTYPVELEMANLPGVVEIRSISKFGLSVVTIVFEDNMGTYLPRQLIAERLKSVEDQIPEGFGSPFMGPISTGLGEIYQYILDVKDGYEDKYSVTELRTIQDWIVKRQLSGISGVVEVNTWGGFLKTYEVAVDPLKLQSMDITLSEIYKALTDNNSVAGGGYIEKSNEAFFIRAEGLAKNIDDIQNIVVKNVDGMPIYVKDIATVGFGAATRFGAITGNGEGEKVLGQVMMLKDADSKKVIDAVIERVAEIQASLPEGVYINPFLERSDLIGRTTFTIAENLIFGFLIVLFVVVFLLGNLRSGLVVASVIPLTLLFALSMMYLFGVDANLMSLGAIDFGIIIDGAVIIIEYIAFSLTQNATKLNSLTANDRKLHIDKLVGEGVDKMMHSAVFGQVIIIIVFIPILVLSGIEGKMFRPMALTFCFALLGAMILCFTYVPVMASLFLKPHISEKPNISTKFVDAIKRLYQPILSKVLKLKYLVLGIAIGLFVLTILVFSRMGGEFIPTLDEGDFVIQPVLKTGMSLAETVNMTTRIEQIIKRFPEVKQVVSRIGGAEVPTDPMSMEESDVIITLEKKSKWTSAKSKDELAEVFKAALLAEIPGVEIEFTQPIEMRFNELISGARSDLAIKLFGEDLEVLYQKASEIEAAIRNVDGAADISVEKIDGLPQMSVQYDRAKIARYGLNISDLNDLLAMGFAGKSAGAIFQGESQFDIVLRYNKEYRNDISSLKNALVDLPSGQQLPLSEFANITYTTGPAKISRDDTKRRVVVGVNVRGRDLQSVVDEVSSIIDQKITIPTGYYIQYGGQFENLEKATQRLIVAVPIALIMIFILLYFAFHSIRESLIIFSAIPLATIGGVFALYLRGMPFSISAGVGFIALFGIAVLNGIVMIEHFKELKSQGMEHSNQLIISGALDRVRPVLLTAIAAALGFLPMAISSSAGAEVQRPLATVVIGGLFTATLLTLFVLPVLYSLFGKGRKAMKLAMKMVVIPILFVLPFTGNSQQVLNLAEVINVAEANNLEYKSEQLAVDREKILIDASREINKTDFYYQFDQNNIPEVGGPLHVLGVGHAFKLPSVHRSKKELHESNVVVQENYQALMKFKLQGEVASIYDQIIYNENLLMVYEQVDSIYIQFLSKAERKYDLGGSNVLEKLSAKQKLDEVQLLTEEVSWRINALYNELYSLTQSSEPFKVRIVEYQMAAAQQAILDSHPSLGIARSMIEKADREREVNYNQRKPEFNLALFNGINSFTNLKLYPGIQAGISIPLSNKQYKAQQSADQISTEISRNQLDLYTSRLKRNQMYLNEKLENLSARIITFDESVFLSTNELLESASTALEKGAIDYFQYLMILDNARQAKIKRLELIHEYNQTTISLQYLSN